MAFGRILAVAVLGTLSLTQPLQARQQTGTVAGRVVDLDTRAPIPAVSIAVANRGAITDANGRFTITGVPAGTHTVTVSVIGYADVSQSVSVTAGQTTTIEVPLSVQAIALERLVVTGYGEQRAADLTGVIETVTPEQFNTGRVVSPEELIQAKVAGVRVIGTGEPGGGVSVRIRGGTSVTSSNEPLFVIDGVPIAIGGGLSAGRNPLNFLNPDDIAGITVLKDASATAIYGSRGANGVVLIETKGGGNAGGALTYTGSVSSSTVINSLDMLSPAQFRTAVQTHAPTMVNLLGSASTNWRDQVQRDAFGQEHSLAFAGSSEDATYRLSLGWLDQDGVVRGSTTQRATIGLNYQQSLLDDRLSVRANLRGARTEDLFTPGGVLGNATAFAPTQPIRDDSSPYGGYFEWADPLGVNNPVAELNLTTNEGTTYRSIGDIEAEWRAPFLESLTATVRLGYDVGKAENVFFAPRILRGQAETGLPGTTSRSNSTQVNRLFDAYLNYGHRLEDAETSLDFTAGYSYEDAHGEFPSFSVSGLSFDLLGPNGVPAAEQESAFLNVQENRLISFFGRTNVTFRDRYLLTASVRHDGSSRFGPDQRWGTFPSAAVAWRISNESFMADNELFSDLKLRASWGKNGNQAFANYQAFSTYVIGGPQAQVQFGDEFVTTIRPGAADPGIKWEETTSYDIGVDFGLWNNRLSGTLDYYFKETEDLIFTVPVAGGTNLSNFVTTNIGTLENRGFELSLDALVIPGGGDGFSWSAGFTAAINDNELVSVNPFGGGEAIQTGGIAGGVGNTVQVLQPGSPVNSFFVYKHRLDGNGRPIYEDTNGDGTINENDLYEDLSGDGIVNQDDRRPFEDPAPKWTFGHSSRMAWRDLDLSFTVRAQFGNYVYNNVASNYGHYATLSFSNAPNNLHASVLETNFAQPQYFSDYYVEDGSFLRMDNLSLGYTLSPGWLTAQPVRIYGTIQNVFTATGYSGIDPEAGLNGIDNNIYPRSRTFSLGATVRF